MAGDHRRHDGSMPQRSQYAGTCGETRPRRHDVVHEQHRSVEIPSAATTKPPLQRSHGSARDLPRDLLSSSTVSPHLRRPPSPRQPVPPPSAYRRRHLDGEQFRVIDAAVAATPPVTRKRHDVWRTTVPDRGTIVKPLEPSRPRSHLVTQPTTEPPPRISVGAVLRGGEHADDLGCIRDEHREFIDAGGRIRITSDRPRHGCGQRVVPPRPARRRTAQQPVAHGFDRLEHPFPQPGHGPSPTIPRTRMNLGLPHVHPASPPRIVPSQPRRRIAPAWNCGGSSGNREEPQRHSHNDTGPARCAGPVRRSRWRRRRHSRGDGRRSGQEAAIFRSTVGRMPPLR